MLGKGVDIASCFKRLRLRQVVWQNGIENHVGTGPRCAVFFWKKPEWESYNCVDILNVARKKIAYIAFCRKYGDRTYN